VKSIAAGWFHNVVVTESGEVYSWGDDSSGALGYNPSFIDRHPKKVNTLCDQNEKITRAYCGARHTILQSEHDKLYGFGDNEQHQLGLQTKKKYFLPEKIPIDDRIISVACGTSHTLVLDCHYKIHATGLNNFGQLGIENGASVAKFTPIINQKRFISIKCGHHSAAISE
jgi:X-linked retinitis pigmentosa GTPase regulator